MSRRSSTNIQTSQAGFWKSPEFADRLRRERLRLSLNQRDFARLGGATLDSQSRYETGKNSPGAEYLTNLAGNGVDVMYILTGQRSELGVFSPSASEMITEFEALPSHLQLAALNVVRAMKQGVDGNDPPPTVHGQKLEYRAGDSG